MTTTLAVVSKKGGVGKTTISRIIAVAALFEGRRSAIIDLDEQASAFKWGERRRRAGIPAPLVGAPGGRALDAILDELKGRGAELVVIDTPPHDNPLIGVALEHADAALIPLQPSPDDLEAVASTVSIVKGMRRKAGIVFNRVNPKTAGFHAALSAAASFGLPVWSDWLGDVVAHQYATAKGRTVQETQPRRPAATQAAALYDWINVTLFEQSLAKAS